MYKDTETYIFKILCDLHVLILMQLYDLSNCVPDFRYFMIVR